MFTRVSKSVPAWIGSGLAGAGLAALLLSPVAAQAPAGQAPAAPRPAGSPAPGGAPGGAPQAPLPPNAWTIDPAHSSANFAVRHMMVSNVHGTFGAMKGVIEYDGKSLSSLKADATIDTTTITTHNDRRDTHLKSADFFDVQKYPEITFKSKKAEAAGAGKFKLTGDLTIRGVTKEVVLEVEGPTPPLVAQGRTRVGASATTKINRQEYGVSWNRNIDGGGYVVGDEITITLELELIKAQPAGATQ
jgi:polyisoprenoid-binding protein YceI